MPAIMVRHGSGIVFAAVDAARSRAGPVMRQADASPPPESAKPQIVEEQIAPDPAAGKSLEVEAPPEQKTQPTPLKPEPEPAKIVPAEAGGR